MRRNLYITSMLRQPARTTLVVVLLLLASFSFFLRTVEFIAVRDEIHQLSTLFRTIGTVRGENYWSDVSYAAAIIEQSPFVGFSEQRVAVEAELLDMLTPDISGMWRGMPLQKQARLNENLFTARVIDIHQHSSYWISGNMRRVTSTIELQVEVLEVFAGRPENVIPGQRLTLTNYVYNLTFDLNDIIFRQSPAPFLVVSC